MISQHNIPSISLTLLLALLLSVSSSHAVQDDPFGDPFGGGAKNGGAAKQGNDDPFGGAATAPAKVDPNAPANVPTPASTDKVVLAIRDTNPTTPSDFIRALRIMFDTNNYDEAKVYLGKLEAAKVSDQVAFELIEEIGSDFVYRLMRSEEMAPQGATFGRSLLASSSRHLTSDAQLQTYFADAASPTISARERAVKGFRKAGQKGLAYLVKNSVSADPELMPHYEVAAALIGSTIREPLESVLATGTDQQKAFAISVLGRSNSRKSIPFLLKALFDKKAPAMVRQATVNAFQRMLGGTPEVAESKNFLRRQIEDLVKGGRPFYVDAFGKTVNWVWNQDGNLLRQSIEPAIARVLRMQRLGQALYEIDPSDSNSEKIYLACQLTALNTLSDQPVTESVQQGMLSAVSPQKWVTVMEYCVKNHLYRGASAAAEILGQVGDESLLRSSDFSPLVKAMESGDRDLRFACTQAIIQMNPSKAFPGASRFTDSLVYFSSTRGRVKALVAHPKFSEGQNLVGTLAQRGIDSSAVTTGRDLYRQASKESDIEFVLVSDAIDRPNLRELLPQLRSLPSLSKVPIGILSQKINHKRNLQIASSDSRVLVMRQPYRVSFRVEQMLPESNQEVNNSIIAWSVLSDILEQAISQNNRTVAIQMLDTMKAAYNDDLSKLAVDNSAIIEAMKHSDQTIRKRASRLFIRVTGEKPLYENPIAQPTTSGRVLVVHPQSGEIEPLKEMLRSVGFTVSTFDSVDKAVQVIPNIESLRFVISSLEFGGLGAEELKKALSKKFRLNPMPITFVARSDSYREAPVAKPVFDSQLEKLLSLGDQRPASPDQRLSQAKICLGFLQKILADRETYGFADPIRHESRIVSSLQNPSLTSESLPVLAELATPNAQQAIVDFASENSRPVAVRTAAVQAFAKAIQKRGILLTKGAILEQYNRYNQSEALDQETQQVLGSILDVIEGPRK